MCKLSWYVQLAKVREVGTIATLQVSACKADILDTKGLTCMRAWSVLQREIQDRRNFCQEVIAFHRDTLRPAALVAAKRRMQRNNGVKAWHGARSLPSSPSSAATVDDATGASAGTPDASRSDASVGSAASADCRTRCHCR